MDQRSIRVLAMIAACAAALAGCAPSIDEGQGAAAKQAAPAEVARGEASEAMDEVSLPCTSWLIRSYGDGKGGMRSPVGDVTLHARFTEEGKLVGSAGCNNFHASYELDGDSITLGPVAATRKMCMGDDVMEQESLVLTALGNVARWEVEGERLELRGKDGAPVLELVPAVTGNLPEPAGP